MLASLNKTFKIRYLNLRAQTGFGTTKQAQVEHFVKQAGAELGSTLVRLVKLI